MLAYGGTRAGPWWDKHAGELRALGGALEVLLVDDAACAARPSLAERGMRLSVTVQDGTAWIADDRGALVEVRVLSLLG